MRGLDTNVLMRYLTADDPVQSPRAASLLEAAEEAGERFYISQIALCELSWTLRGRPYKLDRAGIASVVQQILDTRLFEVQSRDLVRRALEDYRQGPADFSDYLLGWQSRDAGCETTFTFDHALVGEPGFSLL